MSSTSERKKTRWTKGAPPPGWKRTPNARQSEGKTSHLQGERGDLGARTKGRGVGSKTNNKFRCATLQPPDLTPVNRWQRLKSPWRWCAAGVSAPVTHLRPLEEKGKNANWSKWQKTKQNTGLIQHSKRCFFYFDLLLQMLAARKQVIVMLF